MLEVILSRPFIFIFTIVVAAYIVYANRSFFMRAPDMWSRTLTGIGAVGLAGCLAMMFYFDGKEPTTEAAFSVYILFLVGGTTMMTGGTIGLLEWLHEKGMIAPLDSPRPTPEPEPGVAEPPAEYKVKEPTPEEKLAEILRRNRRE